MDIQEALKLKQTTENGIREIIQMYQNLTGLYITSVTVETSTGTHRDTGKPLVVGQKVSVTVKL